MPSESAPSNDADLLARLNALKKSSVSLSTTNSLPAATPESDDLAARFLSFKSAARKDSKSFSDDLRRPGTGSTEDEAIDAELEDDKTIEELLAGLEAEDQWTLNPEDPKDIARLMEQAKEALKTSESQHDLVEQPDDPGRSKKTKPEQSVEQQRESDVAGVPPSKQDQIPGFESERPARYDIANEQTEDKEAEVYLQQMIDELSLEKDEGEASVDPATTRMASTDQISASHQGAQDSLHTNAPFLGLPSIPSSLPLVPSSPPEADSSGDTDSFQLPSAPTAAPNLKGKKTKSSLLTYTDAEIDSWCIICYNDATIRCNGCENDLYCAKCWREGHTGPDAAFDFKTHRWAKYSKPK